MHACDAGSWSQVATTLCCGLVLWWPRRDGLAVSSCYALLRVAAAFAAQPAAQAHAPPPPAASPAKAARGPLHRAAALEPAGPIDDDDDEEEEGYDADRRPPCGASSAGSTEGSGLPLGAFFPTPCKRIDAARCVGDVWLDTPPPLPYSVLPSAVCGWHMVR